MTTLDSPLPGICRSEIAKATAPLDEAWTLPPAAYSSPELGTLEKDRVLRKSWIPIGRVDQVATPGDYLSIDLLGQPLMITHGTDGKIRVMSRVCLHRGAPIAEGSGNKRLFVCPYHAWSYTNDGKLKKAPLMDGAKAFDESKCRLPEIRTEIWNGFIVVNFDDEAEPLAEQTKEFDAYFDKFQLSDTRIVRTMEFDSHWNWKVLVENFMEAYHHIAIHSRTFEPIYHARDSQVIDDDGLWSILHMPAAKPNEPHGFPAVEGLEDWQRNDLFAAVIFPFFMLGIQSNAIAWYQVLPLGPDRLTLKIHLCVPESSLAIANSEELMDQAIEMISTIHHEDIEANDMVWKGLNAPLSKQGRLSPLEKSIWHLNQWWLSQMQAGDA